MNIKTAITDKVKAYYLKGLNYKEIGKLLDLSPRSVQRYAKAAECRKMTEPKSLQRRALEMHANGWSYAEIGRRLKVSKTTVYLWHKKAKAATLCKSR